MMFISLFRVSETYEIKFSVMYNCEKERMGKLIFLNLSTLESTSKSTFCILISKFKDKNKGKMLLVFCLL